MFANKWANLEQAPYFHSPINLYCRIEMLFSDKKGGENDIQSL